MNNTKPQDIATLLGQATQLPWKFVRRGAEMIHVEGTQGAVPKREGIWGREKDGKEIYVAWVMWKRDPQLIVLSVNALPAFLKLREAAAAVMVECAVDTPPSLGAIANLDAAVVKVDTALGLSPEPSSTPVDTVRKQKSVVLDEKTKEPDEKAQNQRWMV